VWFDCVAYAAGSEHDSNEVVEDSSSSVVTCEVSTAGTDAGRDKLQCVSDSADGARDITVVCPSGEAADSAVTKSVTTADHSHKSSSVFRSCSMPQMHSRPPAVTAVNDRSVDSELRYLSTYAKLQRFTSSPLENSKNGQIAKSPFMSPLLASDEMLQQLCPVHLIVRIACSFFYVTN